MLCAFFSGILTSVLDYPANSFSYSYAPIIYVIQPAEFGQPAKHGPVDSANLSILPKTKPDLYYLVYDFGIKKIVHEKMKLT